MRTSDEFPQHITYDPESPQQPSDMATVSYLAGAPSRRTATQRSTNIRSNSQLIRFPAVNRVANDSVARSHNEPRACVAQNVDAADVTTSNPTTETSENTGETELLELLRARRLSFAEAAASLASHGVEDHAAEKVLRRLCELGYLDDGNLAEHLVHVHYRRKGLSRTIVETEMRRRVLDPEAIAVAMAELPSDERGRATACAEERARKLKSVDVQAERRLVAFLLRKGYSLSDTRFAVDNALKSRRRNGVRFT